MPYKIVNENGQHCVHRENADGSTGERIKCYDMESEARDHMRALYANVEDAAAKYFSMLAVKAVGDWELDIRAVPFGMDYDRQIFDEQTDFMLDDFKSPAIFYYHGLKEGRRLEFEDKPTIIGKALSVEKRHDGVYVRALLDKTVEYAHRVWEAAKRGTAVASSDSIMHLARLDVGGKKIMYEKTRPGRVTNWPLAGVSLWELDKNKLGPTSPRALAMPAMKAIYREAGLPFPDLDTTGDAEAESVKRRTEVLERSKQTLKAIKGVLK